MTKKMTLTDVVALLVSSLEPFSSEERGRAVSATMTLLGETVALPKQEAISSAREETRTTEAIDEGQDEWPKRVTSWIRQNSITLDQIRQIFHRGGEGFEVITAEVPGKTNRDRIRNAYVLLGISRFLTSGDASFDDKSARALCEKLGIFDRTNHAKYMKGGNEFTGSKDKGWVLTAPGLKRGAGLILELAQ